MTAEQAYQQVSRYFPWDHYLPTGAPVIFSSPPPPPNLTWPEFSWFDSIILWFPLLRTQKIIVQKQIPRALGFAFHLVKELSYSSLGAGKLVL